jgi:hypothetical protein
MASHKKGPGVNSGHREKAFLRALEVACWLFGHGSSKVPYLHWHKKITLPEGQGYLEFYQLIFTISSLLMFHGQSFSIFRCSLPKGVVNW